MGNNGKRYTEEFKQQIVDLYNSGKSAHDLAGEYGVTAPTIYRWIKELTPIETDDGETMTRKEMKKLKKEIARLRTENEILKKATAIFADKRKKK